MCREDKEVYPSSTDCRNGLPHSRQHLGKRALLQFSTSLTSNRNSFFMTSHANLLNFVRETCREGTCCTPRSVSSWRQFSALFQDVSTNELPFSASQSNTAAESTDTRQESSQQRLQVSTTSPDRILSPGDHHKCSVSSRPCSAPLPYLWPARDTRQLSRWPCHPAGTANTAGVCLLWNRSCSLGFWPLLGCFSWGAGEKASVFPPAVFGPRVNSQQLKAKSKTHFFHKQLTV